MNITERQFQIYLEAIPPVIWGWIYGELKDGDAKSACYSFLFDEKEQMRDLTRPWMRAEFAELVSKFPEVRAVAMQAAKDFYIRNSWRKWLPWNWKK
jgi:hypothetical protein